jgi:hypothetical protein
MKNRAQLEWQTIDTAPRDGTPILVVLPDGPTPQSGVGWVTALFGRHVMIAAWTSRMPGEAPGWLTFAAATAILSGKRGAEDDIEPTHWSPLPPPASIPSNTSSGTGPQPEAGEFIGALPCWRSEGGPRSEPRLCARYDQSLMACFEPIPDAPSVSGPGTRSGAVPVARPARIDPANGRSGSRPATWVSTAGLNAPEVPDPHNGPTGGGTNVRYWDRPFGARSD